MMRGLRDGISQGVLRTSVEFCTVTASLAFALQSALEVTQGVFVQPVSGAAAAKAQPANYKASFFVCVMVCHVETIG
jgi:cysteine synthase